MPLQIISGNDVVKSVKILRSNACKLNGGFSLIFLGSCGHGSCY